MILLPPLEADIDGDGTCDGDPELIDRDGDGTRELPAGVSVDGKLQFTCFYVPDDVSIVAGSALEILASDEVAVFGSVRLASGTSIAALSDIDLRSSAWLSEDGTAVSVSAKFPGDLLTGLGDLVQSEAVAAIDYASVCSGERLCGDFNADGQLFAVDALGVLASAVGAEFCSRYVCDADSNGKIVSSDALAVLKKAVGSEITLNCPQP